MATRNRRAAPAAAALAAGDADAERHAYVERVVLHDGSVAVVTPLTSGDVAAIDRWFEGLGPETRYERFLAPVSRLDDRTRSRLAEVDHWDHEALMAVMADGAIAGIARYIRLPTSSTAEVSVAVADRWRGLGIGSLLLDRIAVRAYAAEIRCLTACCLWSNIAILRLLGRLGPMTATDGGGDVVEVSIDLRSQSPTATSSSASLQTGATRRLRGLATSAPASR